MTQHLKFKHMMYAVVVALLLLVSTSLVLALVPEQYWGYVSIDGALYNQTGNVSVHSLDGSLIAHSDIPSDDLHPGSYHLYIPFRDEYNSRSKGAYSDEPLVWKVNGISVLSPRRGLDRAEPGKVNNVFNLSGINNPVLDASLSVADQSYLGDDFLISGILKNAGYGDALVDISLSSPSKEYLLSGSPSEFELLRNKSVSFNYITTFDKCGSYEFDFSILAENYAGDKLDELSYRLPVDVVGHDLALDNVSYKLLNDSTVYFSLYISSHSSFVTGFEKVKVYQNGVFIKDVEYNLAIDPYESGMVEFPIVFSKPVQSGDSFEFRIVSLESVECNMTNNKFVQVLKQMSITDPLRNGYDFLDELDSSLRSPQLIDSSDESSEPGEQLELGLENASLVTGHFDLLVLFLMIVFFFILCLLMFITGKRILSKNDSSEGKSAKKEKATSSQKSQKKQTPVPVAAKPVSAEKAKEDQNTLLEKKVPPHHKLKKPSFFRSLGFSKGIPQDRINELLQEQAPEHLPEHVKHEIVPGVVIATSPSLSSNDKEKGLNASENNACVESNLEGDLVCNSSPNDYDTDVDDLISGSYSAGSNDVSSSDMTNDIAIDDEYDDISSLGTAVSDKGNTSGIVESVLERIYSGERISAIDEDSMPLDSTDMLLDSEVFSSGVFEPIRNNIRFPVGALEEAKHIIEQLLSADDEAEYDMYLKSLLEDESISSSLVKILSNALMESADAVPRDLESDSLGTTISYPQMVQYVAFLRSN